MSAFIDTNSWLYVANPSSHFYDQARKHLEPYLQGRKPFAVCWQIFYEFIRAATDPRLFSKPSSWEDAFSFISKIFHFPGAQILQEGFEHDDSLQTILKKSRYVRGHFIHDCHIATLLYENGISEIITSDKDFLRFDFLKIIDPTLSD